LSFHSIIFLYSKHHLQSYSYVFPFLCFATTLIFLSCVFFLFLYFVFLCSKHALEVTIHGE
jgi:hypothetical protein